MILGTLFFFSLYRIQTSVGRKALSWPNQLMRHTTSLDKVSWGNRILTNSPKKLVPNRKKMLPKRLAKEGAVDTRRSNISEGHCSCL